MSHNFAQNLRIIRGGLELNQREFGKLVGLDPTQIAHYENSNRDPSLANAVAIATALGVSLDALVLGGGDFQFNITRTVKEISHDRD